MAEITDGEVVKMDTVGRTRMTMERIEALMAEFTQSGMSGVQFAKWAGIKYSTFAGWKKRLKQVKSRAGAGKKSSKPSSETQWVEAIVDKAALSAPGTSRSSALVVELGRGVRMEVGDQEGAHLAALVLGELLGGSKRC